MFPIAALLEVGNVNLSRVELIWSPITTHLSEVRERERGEEERDREKIFFSIPQACSVGSPSLRAFAAEALTLLIRTSLENYSEEVHYSSTYIPSNSILCHFSIPIPENSASFAASPGIND